MFKVGDRVVCIRHVSPPGTGQRIGQFYTITDVFTSQVSAGTPSPFYLDELVLLKYLTKLEKLIYGVKDE